MKTEITYKIIIISLIMIIAFIFLDYINILSIIKLKTENFNFDFLNIIINTIIVIMLYLITYFLIDKENIRKNNTQKDILKSLLKETYKECINYINILDYETLSKYIVPKIDFNSTTENIISKNIKNNAFSNHDTIIELFKIGIVSIDNFNTYIEIRKDYFSYVTFVITFFDAPDKTTPLKNELLKKLCIAIKKIESI